MNCDLAQLTLSARMDGERIEGDPSALDDHVAGCERCRAFVSSAERMRTAVRIRPAQPVPDLVGTIVDELEALSPGRARAPVHPQVRTGGGKRLGWRRAMPAVAALIAGAVIGSVLVGGPFRGNDREAFSANAVVQGVRGASPSLESFDGTFEVVERGLSADVPIRRLDVHIAFLAPQRFRLDVVDRTAYPPESSTPTDITFIENGATTYRSGPTGCPADLSVDGCPITRTTVTTGSTPSDLMVPVTTFGSPEGVRVLGTHRVDEHDVVRVELSFARAAPMFPFLQLGDTWRPFFRGDRVEVELDAATWLPRRMRVFPASTEQRRAWELRFGRVPEDPAIPILEVAATSVSTRAPEAPRFEIPGEALAELSVGDLADRLGYRPATPTSTGDLELVTSVVPPADPSGPRSVLVYADGLDYLRVGERPGWQAPELFGRVGADAMQVVLPGGGIAYYAPPGDGEARRLSIRGEDTSLFLETNLPRHELFMIAGSIPVQGRSLP